MEEIGCLQNSLKEWKTRAFRHDFQINTIEAIQQGATVFPVTRKMEKPGSQPQKLWSEEQLWSNKQEASTSTTIPWQPVRLVTRE